MSVSKTIFGQLPDGREVEKITMCGAGGLTVSLITYGAAVQEILFAWQDVALGFDVLEDYLHGSSFQGAMIGRYGNRIAKGELPLDGRVYDIGCNEGGFGHLHGGAGGFHTRLWSATILEDSDTPSVRFAYISEDGEEGYPGRLDVAVDVTVTANNSLVFVYQAISDQDTVVNLTNHTYFNLHGFQNGNIMDVELQVLADAITPVDQHFIPTGEIRSVDGTPFDFRVAKPIGRDMDLCDEQLAICGGYDHNFVFGAPGEAKLAARAVSHKSGIGVECTTDQPGMQVYVSNGLSEPAGKGGVALYKHQGLCLETQHYPDSPHHENFPSTMLRAGETFRSQTSYHFFCEKK